MSTPISRASCRTDGAAGTAGCGGSDGCSGAGDAAVRDWTRGAGAVCAGGSGGLGTTLSVAVLFSPCSEEWVGSGRVTIRHVSPLPPLDPCVRLSSHTAHDRGAFTGSFYFVNSTAFTVVSLRVR